MTKIEIKQNIHSLVDIVEDVGALSQIQEMLVSYKEEKLKLSSLSDEERKSINKGLDQLKNGEKIDYEDIKSKFPEWLRN